MKLRHYDTELFQMELTERELSLVQSGLRETLDALDDEELSTRTGASAEEFQELLSAIVQIKGSLNQD